MKEDITNAGHPENESDLEKEQAHVVEQLMKTLAMNPRSTLSVLRDIYGLSSPVPSAFSLYVLDSVRLKEACPFMDASKQKLIDSLNATELEKAYRESGCDK